LTREHFGSTNWQKIVNRAFSHYWRAMKKLRQVGASDSTKWKQAFDEAGAQSRLLAEEKSKLQNPSYANVWREIMKPLDGEQWLGGGEPGRGYAVNPESSGIFRNLVYLLLGTTFRELITELEKTPRAYSKLLKVHNAYYRLRLGKASYSDLKLKFHNDHFSIMVQGLDFGLDQLNEWQLADCFDEICPCGRWRHSVGSLSKFRTSVKRACERLRQSVNEPTSFDASGR
jgi:hypothetical protein